MAEIIISSPSSATIDISNPFGTSDHAKLRHLEFENSGHIGFQEALTAEQLENISSVPNKADKSTTYTKTEVDMALAGKANQSTTYTKTETDSAISAKADKYVSNGGFIAGQGAGIYNDEYADTFTGVVIGKNAQANEGGNAISIGRRSWVEFGDGVAIGDNAIAGDEGIAIGKGAVIYGYNAIQLGAGTNNEPDTLQVFDNVLLDEDGYVPNERLSTISSSSGTTLSYDFSNSDRTEKRCGTLTSIAFTYDDDEYSQAFISSLSFNSGATPTSLTYTASPILNWVGTDCTLMNGISLFIPSANTHYDILFYFNGTQFVGMVNGFVPATGNVVSE